MDNNDSRKWLYESLKGKGYDLGSYDEFDSHADEADTRKWLYETARESGFDMGSYEDFDKGIGYRVPRQEETISVNPQTIADTFSPTGSEYLSLKEIADGSKFAPVGFSQNTEANAMSPYSVESLGSRLQQLKKDGKLDMIIHQKEERELDRIYSPKKVENETDALENYRGRFGLTERGKFLNEELDGIRKEITDRYTNEYLASDRYKQLSSQYSGRQLNEEIDKDFQQQYGDRISKDMAPYMDAYNQQVFNRYDVGIQDDLTTLAKGRTINQVADLRRDIEQELEKTQPEINAPAGSVFIPSSAYGAAQRYGNVQSKEQQDRYTSLVAAKNLLDEADDIVNEASKKGNTTFLGGFGRGARDKGFDVDTWAMGITDTAYGSLLKKAAQKSDRGEELSSEEKKLLEAAAVNMATQAYFSSDLGRGYKAGSTSAQSIPFMLEFALNPVSGSGNAIAKGILKYGAKRFGLKALESSAVKNGLKIGSRLAGDTVAAAGMTATSGLGHVASGAQERMMGDVQFDFDNSGKIEYAGHQNQMSAGDAWLRSTLSNTLENQSEMVFNAFKGADGVVGLPKTGNLFPGIERFSASKAGELYRAIKNNPTYRKLAERTQFHGMPEEYFEEVYNNLVSLPLGEGSWEESTDIDNNIDTFLGVAPTSIVMSMLGLGSVAKESYSTRRNRERFEKTLSQGELSFFKDLKQKIKDGNIEDAKKVVKLTLNDKKLTSEQKKERIRYVYDMLQQNTIEAVRNAETEDAIQKETDDIVNSSNQADGTVTECSRITTNEIGETVLVPGHIVGWMGGTLVENPDGTKSREGGQPIWQAVGSKERITLHEGEYEPESIKSMPVQDMMDATVEMMREEANKKAEMESKYDVKRIDPPSGGTTFIDINGRQITIVDKNPNDPTNGWIAKAPKLDEKGNPKKDEAGNVLEENLSITNADYYDAMQAQLDAQEKETALQQKYGTKVLDDGRTAVITSERNGEISYDVIGFRGNLEDSGNMSLQEYESLRDYVPVQEEELDDDGVPVNSRQEENSSNLSENQAGNETLSPAGENILSSNEVPDVIAEVNPATEPMQEQKPLFPVDEKGNILYHKMPVEDTIADLTDGTLDNNEIDGFIAANKAEAGKLLKKVSESAPKISTNKAKYLADKKAWQEKVADVQARVDYWNSVGEEIAASRVQPGDKTAEAILSMGEPMNGEELAAMMLGTGRLPILYDSYKKETGGRNAEARGMVGLFATKANGGLSVEEAGEQLMLADQENGTHFFDENDPNAGRNAIIDVLSGARTRGDLFGFIQRNREALAERERQAELEAYEQTIARLAEASHMTPEEFIAFEENIAQMLEERLKDIPDEELKSIFAELYLDENYGRSRESDEVGTGVPEGEERAGGNEGSPGILSEERGDNAGASEYSEKRPEVDDEIGQSGDGVLLEADAVDGREEIKFTPPTQIKGENLLDYAARVVESKRVHDAGSEVDTTPTEAQKEAGNYKKGHVKIDGFDITIENPKGSVRSGVDADGKPWNVTMNNTYGYIRGTEGVDGDHIDVFLGDSGNKVYVVDQLNTETGAFDEHKVMYGFNSTDEATEAYLSNYSPGWQGLGAISEVSKETFKKWIDSSHRKTKPFVEYKIAKDNSENAGVRFREVKDSVSSFASEYNLEKADVRKYAQSIQSGNLGGASYAFQNIRRKVRLDNPNDSFMQFSKRFAPIREKLYEEFGNIDELREEAVRVQMEERNVMEAARKRIEEEAAKESERLREFQDMSDDHLDEEYFKAVEENNEPRMRDLVNEAARRKGYEDIDSDYQGVGAWAAPSDPGYESTEARRADVEENSPDVNIEDISKGYSPQPNDYFSNLRAYGTNTPEGGESAQAINRAIDEIQSTGNIPMVKVYRAVPTEIKEGSIRNADWVTPSRKYAEMHGNARLEGKYRLIEQEVPANKLWWDGNDINEWGFDDGKDYRYKNAKNNRKLNNLITRDDNGNIIPLSKRFNSKNEDVRFRETVSSEEQAIIDEAKKNGTYLKAPNGKPTNLNEKQWAQVRTESFKKWFGDWENEPDTASKVIDENGEPKVVKHGTPNTFFTFSKENIGNNDPGWLGTGFYFFGNNEIYANQYAGNNGLVMDTFLNIRNPYYASYSEMEKIAEINSKESSKDFSDKLKDEGFDGVSYNGDLNDEWVAYEPIQIKSATVNVGQFSTENDDIRYREEEVQSLETKTASIVSSVNELSESLHTPIRIVKSTAELPEGDVARKRIENGDGIKGWFDTKSEEMAIYLPNAANVEDARESVFHEVVGHYGLRKLFGEDFNTFLDNVYANVSPEIRKQIVARAKERGNILDLREATEEYLAALAERGFDSVEERTLWQKIKDAFIDMLRKAGVRLGFDLTDNELRYVLWKSYQNLKGGNGILEQAQDIAFQMELGVGRFRKEEDAEREMSTENYERALHTVNEFAEKHVGAGNVFVIRSKEKLREQLEAKNFTPEAIGEIEKWMEEGHTKAFFDPNSHNPIFVLDTNISNEKLNAYLWHENTHKALRDLFKDRIDEEVLKVYDSFKVDKNFEELDTYIRELYVGEAEETIREECIVHFFETLYDEYGEEALGRNLLACKENIKNRLFKKIYNQIVYGTEETTEPRERVGRNAYSGHEGLSPKMEMRNANDEKNKSGRVQGETERRFRTGKTGTGEEENTVRAYEKEIRELNNRISSLERAIERYENGENVSKAVVDEIKRQISSDFVNEINKSELNSLLAQVQKAKTKKSLEKIFMNVKRVALDAHSRKLQRVIDKLLALKVQDVNGKNMSIAKNVDDSTRKIFTFIRGNLSDLKISGLEDEILFLKRENRKRQEEVKRLERVARDSSDVQERESSMTSIEELKKAIEESKKSIKELRDEANEIKESVANFKDIDIEKELGLLNDKIERAARNEDTWTQSDNERMAALNIISATITNKKHDYEIRDIELRIQKMVLNNSDLYRERGGLKDEVKRKRINEKIKENHRQIGAMERLINDTRSMQVQQMQMTIDQLNELISNGKNSLLRKTEDEMKRKRMLIGNAIRSVEGKPVNIKTKDLDKERTLKKFFSAPMGSFEYMCQRVNTKTLGKDGFLYKRFIEGSEGTMRAYDTYILGMKEIKSRLNEKTRELFGKSFEKITSLSDKVVNESGVHVFDPTSGDGYGVRYEEPMSKGQAMYIYQVWKMADGRTKLELQGFDEESIAEIVDFIGPEYVKFADWVQEEFLPELRERYNDRYLEMYNTSLAKIENYIPLKINKNAIREESSLSDDGKKRKTLEEKAGSLINRVVNTHPVDMVNGFNVLLEHTNQMEEWNAYARVRRDLDYILSSTIFRNQLNANVRGSYKNFYDAAEVATMVHHPESSGHMDEVLGKISKGIVGGNISFRLYTAIKQTLSAPAFLGYSQSPFFMAYLAKNASTPYQGFKWCMENIPSFYERVTSGTTGNEKLNEKSFKKWMDKYIEYGMIPNKLVDALTCSFGAKSIYDYKYSQLKKSGLSEKESHNQALAEADIYYNATQQSSHPAFLSPMQMSRTFTDRMFTTYQNSNIGYVRKVMASYYDLTRSLKWKELKKNYTEMYMQEGLSGEEAESKAYCRLLNENKKHVVELALFGWGLNMLWNIGSQGLLGFLRGDGDDDDKWTKGLAFMLTSPMKGLPGGNLLESIASGYGMNPFLVFEELEKFMKEAKYAIDEYGLISPEIAYITLSKASRYTGVDLEVWGNVYLGVEGMARDGALADDRMIDVMYLLNAPKSNRATVAKELYRDEPLLDFAEKVARANKYIPKRDAWEGWVPGTKDLTKRRKNEIAKEYERLHMTEEQKKEADERKIADKHKRKLKELEDDILSLAEYIDSHKEEHQIYKKYY